jgi:hypothetical protein
MTLEVVANTDTLNKLIDKKQGAQAADMVSKMSDAELQRLDPKFSKKIADYFKGAEQRLIKDTRYPEFAEAAERYAAQTIRLASADLSRSGFKPVHIGGGCFDVTESHDATNQLVGNCSKPAAGRGQ